MHRWAAKFWLLVAATCSLFLVTHARQQPKLARVNVSSSCIPHERDALLAFKQGITSDKNNLLASWQQGQDCCRWTGITCSNQSGHVIKLDLNCSSIPATYYLVCSTIPANYYLVGQISPSLLSLEYLEYLDLSWNSLEGPNSTVPEFLGSMKNLRHLDLAGIPFSSRLPPLLGNLTKLEYLDLSDTSFSGSLPPQLGNLSNLRSLDLSYMQNLYSTDISWLTQLHLLEYIDMSTINLSKVADLPSVVNMIPTLKYIRLFNCSLTNANQSLTHLNLTKLEGLDLSSNYLNHPISFCWFWNLTSIERLDLSQTYLYGPFPNALGSMTSLRELFFLDNGNAATIPVDLEELCALEYLVLDGSLSSGNITELVEKLPQCSSNKLQILSLSGNNMTGILPDRMEHLTSLVYLDLSNNSITGAIPQGIGSFTSLFSLDLSNNHLTETLPLGTGNHTSLSSLILSNNNLTGNIPLGIGNYTSLQFIELSNNHLIGPIHPVIGNSFPSLSILDLSNNHLSGVIPLGIGNSTSLSSLTLHSNQLTGQIPTLPTNLIMLDISMNLLLGPLPLDFGAPNIQALILFSNHISGHIPRSICELQHIFILDLSNNSLEGELSKCFKMPNIFSLLLSNNNFSGEFPSLLQSCSSLSFVDLSWNKFYGRLPQWIGELVYLQFLQLSHNKFYGHIPVNVTNLRRLRYLNLAGNKISGAIPWSLSNLLAMTIIQQLDVNDMLYWYIQLAGEFREILTVVIKHQELKYGAGMFELVGIDLSINHLTGEIPNQITSLSGLLNLNLSWNHLDGKIPENIGAMKSVESLDLSRNNLYSEIPTSLSDLSYLSYMDLSYNNFTGRIPSGRQLDTLYVENPFMYDGNSGLCGPPLQRNCSGNNNASVSGHQKTSDKDSEPMFFYLGLGSGFTVGFWFALCALLFKKQWRSAYFHLFDKAYDKVYVFLVVSYGRLARESTNN